MPNDPSSGIVGLRGSRCHIPHVPARRTDNPPVGRLPNCSRRHQRRCVLAPFRRRLRPHRHADTSASRRTARLKSTTVSCKNNASQKGWELEKPHRSSSDREPVMSIAWFPAGEWTEARRRWTDLQEQGLPADQCRVQQGHRVKHPASVARCRTQPPRRADHRQRPRRVFTSTWPGSEHSGGSRPVRSRSDSLGTDARLAAPAQ